MTIDRTKTLGGSEVAAVLGLDPYRTPLDVWREKVGAVERRNVPATRRGSFLEPAVLRRYLGGTPFDSQLVLTREGWRSGTIDARIGTRIVEVKTVSARMWRDEAWGDPGSDAVPDRVLMQAMWYGDLADAGSVEVLVAVVPDDPDEVLGLTADEVAAVCKLHPYPIARNAELEKMIVDRARYFWESHVVARVAPPSVDLPDAQRYWTRAIAGKTVPADDEVIALVEKREAIKLGMKTLGGMLDRVDHRLVDKLGDAEAYTIPNLGPILTRKLVKRTAHEVKAAEYRAFHLTKWWTRMQEQRLPMAAPAKQIKDNDDDKEHQT